jgi:riboflavin biosynthesis pyrimidine reductase
MPGDDDATQFTVLGDTGQVGRDGLADRYAYPDDLTRCWVRGNMVASVDGGATSGGKSGDLGGDGDRAVFETLRELADVVVAGASTVRTEDYSGVQLTAAQRAARQQRGQSEVPPIAVLTKSGQLDHDAKVLHRTDIAPLILTSAAAAPDTRRRLGDLADVIDTSGDDRDSVDLATALTALADRGLHRVLVEGGPGILGMFVDDDLLDELCLTVAPLLVGGDATRIVGGSSDLSRRLERRHALADDDGFLFLRYVRAGRDRDASGR